MGMTRTYFVKWWKFESWHLPRWYNNLYRELDFGKFSVFLGWGKNASIILAKDK